MRIKAKFGELEALASVIKTYRDRLPDMANEISLQAVERGKEELERRYETAGIAAVSYSETSMPNPADDVKINIEETDKGKVKLVATGSEVMFLEFGAGMAHNTPQVERPSYVKNIAEYSTLGRKKSLGQFESWSFKDDNGQKQKTEGIPASRGMYHAENVMREEIKKVAKGVLENDRLRK
jgi:hypothetical protein